MAIFIQSTEPSTPAQNDIWLDTTLLRVVSRQYRAASWVVQYGGMAEVREPYVCSSIPTEVIVGQIVYLTSDNHVYVGVP